MAGVKILDVGSGRTPTISIEARPPGCWYVALDISAHELRLAPPGGYHHVYEADLASPVDELRNKFDLVVSYQLLEHIRSLDLALNNVRSYLRPGGRFVAFFSARYAVISILNRLLPNKMGASAMKFLLGRPTYTVFPAYYDKCWHSALEAILTGWSDASILPIYRSAVYFNFSPLLQNLYLHYENWTCYKDRKNLATNYLIDAIK